ncbi:MAG TPA: DEAD/DEAH box helicase [Edaphobacter sp.]|nr:DEAD/DEAH box helicase [Edaphobacter sp.]
MVLPSNGFSDLIESRDNTAGRFEVRWNMSLSALRPYQLAALQASKCHYDEGVTRQIMALPTGTGKTVIFSHLREHHQIEKRMLVLVHTEELARQALEKLRRHNNVRIGVEKAAEYASMRDEIVIGSVPTLGRKDIGRLGMFHPETFGAIVCDEAHHATAETYQRIFQHFGLYDGSNKILLLGVTATPYRRNGDQLGSVFQKSVFHMPMNEAIEEGWLCDLRAYRVRSGVSLDGVAVQANDFNTPQLETTVNTRARNELVVRSWYEHAEKRSTIVFCVDIQHARDLSAVFQRENVAAECIWGADPNRKEKLERHRRGDITVLTNCGVLIEGYDDPRISCIVLARPTMSQPLFVQMIGRGTRLEPGLHNLKEALRRNRLLMKPDCIVIDVTDNTTKHRLMTIPLAFDLDPDIRMDGKSFSSILKICAEDSQPVRGVVESASAIKVVSEYIDLFAPQWHSDQVYQTISLWFRREDGFVRILPDDGFIKIAWSGVWTVTGKIEKQTISPFTSTSFAEASGHAEKMFHYIARDLLAKVLVEERKLGQDATPTQLKMMQEAGMGTHHEGITRQQALDRIIDAAEKELDARCLHQKTLDTNDLALLPPGDAETIRLPDRNPCIDWTAETLRGSSLKWFHTDDGGYACPLPQFGQISIYPTKGGWQLSGRIEHMDLDVLGMATLEDAVRHVESRILRPGTELYAAVEQEASATDDRATILQLELLGNLRDPLHVHELLSRAEASLKIDALYSCELMAGEAKKPRRPHWQSGEFGEFYTEPLLRDRKV